MNSRILAVLFISVFIFACADSQVTTPTSSPLQISAAGILQGKVTIGPICSVEMLENPCLPPPSMFTSHKLVILDQKGQQVKQVDMDGAGKYKTELIPGNYTIDFTPRDIGLPGAFQPPAAEIREGETTTLNIDIDTGIR